MWSNKNAGKKRKPDAKRKPKSERSARKPRNPAAGLAWPRRMTTRNLPPAPNDLVLGVVVPPRPTVLVRVGARTPSLRPEVPVVEVRGADRLLLLLLQEGTVDLLALGRLLVAVRALVMPLLLPEADGQVAPSAVGTLMSVSVLLSLAVPVAQREVPNVSGSVLLSRVALVVRRVAPSVPGARVRAQAVVPTHAEKEEAILALQLPSAVAVATRAPVKTTEPLAVPVTPRDGAAPIALIAPTALTVRTALIALIAVVTVQREPLGASEPNCSSFPLGDTFCVGSLFRTCFSY